MRTILIPTDFSDCAINATNYAVEIAKVTKSKIVLYNSFYYVAPLSRPEAFFDTIALETIREDSLSRLKTFVEETLKLNERGVDFDIDQSVSIGNLSSEVNTMIDKHSAELVVIGTHGMTGAFQKFFIGSNAASMIEDSKVPVLVVPHKYKFSPLSKIVFASSFGEIKDTSILESISELSWLLSPQIIFLTVVKSESDLPTDHQMEEYLKLNSLFNHVNHRLETVVNHHVIDGINNYILDNKPDLLVTIPGKHNFIEQIFSKSVSQELVYEALLPILCLK
jgi:nucleotide-binding universal stress UspA family protein